MFLLYLSWYRLCDGRSYFRVRKALHGNLSLQRRLTLYGISCGNRRSTKRKFDDTHAKHRPPDEEEDVVEVRSVQPGVSNPHAVAWHAASPRPETRSLSARLTLPQAASTSLLPPNTSLCETLTSTCTFDSGDRIPIMSETDRPRTVDKVWTSPLENVDASKAPSHLAPTNPSHDVCARSPMAHGSNKRIVYADDTLTHSVLPHMIGHSSFNATTPQGRNSANIDVGEVTMMQVTIACPRPPSADWDDHRLQHAADHPLSHLAAEDVMYICNVKHILAFPPSGTCDALMDAVVRHFLPAYPVVDRMELQKMYLDFRNGTIVSPMLMHSIFFAACQYTEESILQEAGFENRSVAQEYFHSRAALLYSLNCEKDQLTLVQSLIFLSPWWTEYSEEKDIRYWTTCACNVAFSMGLHKAIPSSSRASPRQRCLWRRIFWTLVVSIVMDTFSDVVTGFYSSIGLANVSGSLQTRDHNVALGLGRPPVINLDDVDVEPLSDTDFYEPERNGAEATIGGCPIDFHFSTDIHRAFVLDLISLSKICMFTSRLLAQITFCSSEPRHTDYLISARPPLIG